MRLSSSNTRPDLFFIASMKHDESCRIRDRILQVPAVSASFQAARAALN